MNILKKIYHNFAGPAQPSRQLIVDTLLLALQDDPKTLTEDSTRKRRASGAGRRVNEQKTTIDNPFEPREI